MVFKMLTFDPDDRRFRPGSPPYVPSAVSSPARDCSSCIGGIITRRAVSPATPIHPSRPLKHRDNARSFASTVFGEYSTIKPIITRQGGQRMIKYSLPSTTTLIIRKGDITTWSVDRCTDAIVNSTNEQMLGGGGADGAIHRAAGPELLGACYKVPEVHPGIRCPTGEARITPGFRLPASHVIATVGPIYYFDSNPQEHLASAYRNSMSVANQNCIQYIAFPAISCGAYGYPLDEAATVAISTIKEYSDSLKEVHCVLFFDEIYDVWTRKAKELLEK